MRHVPIAEFKDRLSEIVASVETGEEVMITRHGRDVAKLVSPEGDIVTRRRTAMEGLARLREEQRRLGVRVTREEAREWIDEGRR
jgi:prevent-host-death family protein